MGSSIGQAGVNPSGSGLHTVFHDVPPNQGIGAEMMVERWGFTRTQLDEYSLGSHAKAAAAIDEGRFAGQITPVKLEDGTVIDTDEGVRADSTAESLSRLRPAFAENGTITAGSASQISDGACAVVVMSAEAAAAAGAPVLAEVGAHGCVAGPDNSLQSQPANAIAHALGKAGLTVADLDLIEINEAFAAVAIQSMRDLGVGPDKVNVNGGAIAIGHPIGMSGARIALHLVYELRRRGGGLGAAALCGGGGQGDALILRAPSA